MNEEHDDEAEGYFRTAPKLQLLRMKYELVAKRRCTVGKFSVILERVIKVRMQKILKNRNLITRKIRIRTMLSTPAHDSSDGTH